MFIFAIIDSVNMRLSKLGNSKGFHTGKPGGLQSMGLQRVRHEEGVNNNKKCSFRFKYSLF